MSAKSDLLDLRATMDQRVVEKVRLILRAESVAPGTCFDAAWPDDQIRARAVSTAMGPAAIDGKDANYIEARFDHLAEQKAIDPVRLALAYQAPRSH